MFWPLQDALARCLACLNKISLIHLVDVVLLTGPSPQTIICSKVATETQKQPGKTI